jgi:hypothetical protein
MEPIIQEIWKYPLEVIDWQMIVMPRNSKILSVQIQHGTLCLWALVDPTEPKDKERGDINIVRIYGTGHLISSLDIRDMNFMGTFQLLDGNFVGHVFASK